MGYVILILINIRDVAVNISSGEVAVRIPSGDVALQRLYESF